MSLESKIDNKEKKQSSIFKKILYASVIGLSLAAAGCPVYGGFYYGYYPVRPIFRGHIERSHYFPILRSHGNRDYSRRR